jgi:hypothetical protein
MLYYNNGAATLMCVGKIDMQYPIVEKLLIIDVISMLVEQMESKNMFLVMQRPRNRAANLE